MDEFGAASPSAFRRREVVVRAGHDLAYDEARWRDALVVVERGEIELHCVHGRRRRFATGAVLWFDGLGLRFLRNNGAEDVVIVALSRRPRGSSAVARQGDD